MHKKFHRVRSSCRMLEPSICLRVRLLIAIGIFLSFAQGSFGLPASSSDLPETREAKELSALEPKVVFLCEYARFQATPEMRSYLAELSDPSLDSVNLVALLKSPNPKIRSLAIFALGRKYDPHLLPAIAPLQSDRSSSYRCPLPVDYYPSNKPESWLSIPETVGDVAREVIHPYLDISGYTNFSDYWAHYEKRNYSVAWFVLELGRAWDAFDLAHPELEAIRDRIAQLPAPDRQWTILCGFSTRHNRPGELTETGRARPVRVSRCAMADEARRNSVGLRSPR